MALKTKTKLSRNLGFFPVFAIGTGTMIGAGIFILPGIAASSAGPAAILSFILGGLIAMATAMSMAELATGMPRAGGTYYFISRAMGPIFGTIIGFGAWIALVFKGSFALVGLAEYFHILIPLPILLVAIVSGLLLLILNYRGAENSGSLQNGIVIGLFIILFLFIGRGVFKVEPENLTPFVPYGTNSIFLTTGLIFVSYLGITQLAAVSEEVKNPSRNLPLAFIASVGAVTILYGGIMLVVNGLLPLDDISGSSAPLIDVARLLGGTTGGLAMIFAGFFATISTANAAILSSSRFPFAMGRDNIIPKHFVDVHKKFGTPTRSILITGGFMILFLLFFNVEQLAKLGSTFNVLIFALVNLSVIILRRIKRDWYKPTFKDPLFPFTQIFGLVASLSLIPQLGLLPFIFSIGVILTGILWFVIYGKKRVQMKYGLLDMIDEDIIPVSIAENEKRVMVSINNPEHENDLLQLANLMGDVIIGLHIQNVPLQTGLEAAQESYNIKPHPLEKQLQDTFEKSVEDKESKYLEVFTHNISETILEQTEREKINLLLMGWHTREKGLHDLGKDIPHKVMDHTRCHIGILKGYFPEKLDNILVPFGGGDSSHYAIYLARRLAKITGAKIKLMRIIYPELEEEDKLIIDEELKEKAEEITDCQVEHEIRERFSRLDGIIEASTEHDFMIIGDTNKRFKFSFMGDAVERIVEHARCPTLMVNRYRPLSKRGITSYFKRKKLNK